MVKVIDKLVQIHKSVIQICERIAQEISEYKTKQNKIISCKIVFQ